MISKFEVKDMGLVMVTRLNHTDLFDEKDVVRLHEERRVSSRRCDHTIRNRSLSILNISGGDHLHRD